MKYRWPEEEKNLPLQANRPDFFSTIANKGLKTADLFVIMPKD